MLITDLDGTLRGSNGLIAKSVKEQLETLGRKRILRAVATGRTLYSARKALPADFPIDLLIFSSGAGALCWKTGELLLKRELEEREASYLCNFLMARRDLSFMMHRHIPENHYFRYFRGTAVGGDFDQRLDLNRGFSEAMGSAWPQNEGATQAVVIVGEERVDVFAALQEALSEYSVIRTTSPLDQASLWIEVFSRAVSKGQAADWLAGETGLSAEQSLVIGNDYNDLDMLEWSKSAFVVANAPEKLRKAFPGVSSCEAGGAAEAIALWLKK